MVGWGGSSIDGIDMMKYWYGWLRGFFFRWDSYGKIVVWLVEGILLLMGQLWWNINMVGWGCFPIDGIVMMKY